MLPACQIVCSHESSVFVFKAMYCTHFIAGADNVYFELPHLSPNLRSSVKHHAQGGQVVLSFSKVERGHQARYTCHAVGGGGRRKKGKVDMVVLHRDKSNVIQDVGEEVGEGRREGEGDNNIWNGGMVDKGVVKDWPEELILEREKEEKNDMIRVVDNEQEKDWQEEDREEMERGEGGVKVREEGWDEERGEEGMRGRVEQDGEQREVVTAAVPIPSFQTMEDRAKVSMLHYDS